MPDATITSTASTFGTISGTFAADQSTVTGTITGTVTGTLTGSVGVPGPQGPTGATGATGATGPAGSPGAPGQGVPVGGTAGQFLSKIDSTNYNTDWTTVNLSVYAVKANNLSDLADAPTARTNLGLGTMATATAADYSTTTVANGLYYPLTGNPSGFLTSVPPPSLTNLTSDISWDGSANIGRLLIAGVNNIGGGQTEARLNFVSGVPTQPATGDFWTNGTDFFYRESGSTKTIASQSYVSATYQTLAGMSSYLTTATAASTYAVIAAGQPTAGTTGQVLTKNSGTNYDSSWATLIPGDRYLTTSTTSNTISNGNKTFTIGTGLSYTPTQNITISYDASNHMHGEVLTYNSGTGVLTVDINHHTGSGTYTAWVVNVGGVTPATSVDFADITGAVSGNANLQSALDLKSNLASPTFTGTPTLPTGTIATTQSPGNNTTALATTAFVTAAVPAFATETEAIVGTSSTTTISPLTMRHILSNAGYTAHTSLVGNYSSYVSGSASVSTLWSNFVGLSVTAANGKVAFLPNSQVS